jgi:hypothetical protein
MTGVGYFFWLAGDAFSVLVGIPPAGLLVLVGGVGTVVSLGSVSSGHGRQALAAILIPMILPMSILLCGVLWAHNTELRTEAPQWPEWLIGGLLLAHFPIAAVLM